MKVTIIIDAKNEFRSRIKAGNGEIVAHSSEGYDDLRGCLNGLRSSIENIQNPQMIKRKTDASGKPFFTIDSPNGNILLKGESYSSNQAMEHGIKVLTKILTTNPLDILDETNVPIDVAILVKAGLPVPTGSQYKIIIDGAPFITSNFGPTGREILAIAGKKSERFELIQKFTLGRTETIEANERVDLRICGVEKFVTIPLDQRNGKGNLAGNQRDFQLSADDQIFLKNMNFKYDLCKEGNIFWLIINNFPIPKGYNTTEAKVALLIPPNYPQTQIDMAYFSPALSLENLKKIPQSNISQNIGGIFFQRWSRHRTAQNPWRPNVDNIETHLTCVKNWLKRETI